MVEEQVAGCHVLSSHSGFCGENLLSGDGTVPPLLSSLAAMPPAPARATAREVTAAAAASARARFFRAFAASSSASRLFLAGER